MKHTDSKDSQLKSDFGVHFDFETAGEEVFDFSISDRSNLSSAVAHKRGIREVRDFILGPKHAENTGLTDRLLPVLTDAKSDLAEKLSKPGLLVDLTV